VLLITNSEWTFTDAMMRFAFEPSLPSGMRWRELFDVVVTSARKPDFFKGRAVLFEVLPDARLEGAGPEGAAPQPGAELHRPAPRGIEAGRVYGGTAADVERFLGLSGDDVLYVGDHVYGDVHVPSLLGWRTALIVRELEADIRAAAESAEVEAELSQLMTEKEILEEQACKLRLAILREKQAQGQAPEGQGPLHARLAETRAALEALDPRIAPLAKQASEASNPTWGLLLRTGNDKSHMARHIERHADVYTSRVSNFALATPYAFLRSQRGTMPHDVAPAPEAGKGVYATNGTRGGLPDSTRPRESRP
jgi:5'-nucleotidase